MTLRTQRFFTLLGKFQCALGKLHPLLVPARHEQKLRIIPEVDGVIGVDGEGLFVEFLGSVVVAANVCEEDGVVAEGVGVVGVGFEGLFVEFLGAVVVVANACEEVGVVA